MDNDGTSPPRSLNSIKCRWADINKKCAKFVGCLSKIERLNRSGQTDQGRMTEALQLYEEEIGKPFQYQHCWEILREDPKWQATLPSKKQRTIDDNVEGSHEPDIGTNDGTDSPAINTGRPLGRKAAKELRKQGMTSTCEPNSLSSVNSSVFSQEYWQKKEELDKAKVERIERALKQHQEQLQLNREQHEIEVIKTELEILNADTSKLPLNVATYYEKMKSEIMRKRGWSE